MFPIYFVSQGNYRYPLPWLLLSLGDKAPNHVAQMDEFCLEFAAIYKWAC